MICPSVCLLVSSFYSLSSWSSQLWLPLLLCLVAFKVSRSFRCTLGSLVTLPLTIDFSADMTLEFFLFLLLLWKSIYMALVWLVAYCLRGNSFFRFIISFFSETFFHIVFVWYLRNFFEHDIDYFMRRRRVCIIAWGISSSHHHHQCHLYVDFSASISTWSNHFRLSFITRP